MEPLRVPERRQAPTPPPKVAQDFSPAGKAFLSEGDDLEAAPSIGPKMAERFAVLGIHTVKDFMSQDAGPLADKLDDAHVDADTLLEWQDQARLVMAVPGLRGTHAQLLVGSGYKTAQAVAEADPLALSANVLKYATTSAGKRVLREGRPPDIEKIKSWVEFARRAAAA
jgi:predicted flap endonuclease-1-like 5' DNA nuclease